MLTFEFTGVEGKMTVSETLTSGMVGKEISVITDSSWNGLQKFAVFRAGNVCKTAALSSQTIQIPKEILLKPFCKLFVGLYGTNAAGNLVIPTIMAEGPYIRYGADPMEDTTAEELPVWKNLQDQIGDLEDLDTLQKDSLVAAVNELAAKINEQPEEEEEDEPGLSSAAAALLVSILRQAFYCSDQSANITALESALNSSGGETQPDEGGNSGGDSGGDEGGNEGGQTPAAYTVTYHLSNVTSGNTASTAAAGSAFSAKLTAADGYTIESVIVTMGGTDITGSCYASGVITIPAVTGNVVIDAYAAQHQGQSETLEFVWTSSYPNLTTFEYTETETATGGQSYQCTKRNTIAGGLIKVDYDPTVVNKFDMNIYIFNADGQPYKHSYDEGSHFGNNTNILWGDPGSGAGFCNVYAPFELQLEEGCTFIACFRKGNYCQVLSDTVTNTNLGVAQWIRENVKITVTG